MHPTQPPTSLSPAGWYYSSPPRQQELPLAISSASLGYSRERLRKLKKLVETVLLTPVQTKVELKPFVYTEGAVTKSVKFQATLVALRLPMLTTIRKPVAVARQKIVPGEVAYIFKSENISCVSDPNTILLADASPSSIYWFCPPQVFHTPSI